MIGAADGADIVQNDITPYGPFGESAGAPPTGGGGFGYTGRQWDAETGLYYVRARYYSPRLGRFLQLDPMGTKDDPNAYLYVGNDPLNATDPTGMEAAPIYGKAQCCTPQHAAMSNQVAASYAARDYVHSVHQNRPIVSILGDIGLSLAPGEWQNLRADVTAIYQSPRSRSVMISVTEVRSPDQHGRYQDSKWAAVNRALPKGVSLKVEYTQPRSEFDYAVRGEYGGPRRESALRVQVPGSRIRVPIDSARVLTRPARPPSVRK